MHVIVVVVLTVVLAGVGYVLGYARHHNVGCQYRVRANRRVLKLYTRIASSLIWMLVASTTIGPLVDWVYHLNNEKHTWNMGTACIFLIWVCLTRAVYILVKAAISDFSSRGDKVGYSMAKSRAARYAHRCRELAKYGKDMIKCPAIDNDACSIDSAEYQTRKVISADDILSGLRLRNNAAGSFSVPVIGRRIFSRSTGKSNREYMLDQWIEQIAQAEEQQKQQAENVVIPFTKTVEVVDLSRG